MARAHIRELGCEGSGGAHIGLLAERRPDCQEALDEKSSSRDGGRGPFYYQGDTVIKKCGADMGQTGIKIKKEVFSFRLNLLFLMVELNGIEPLAS